MGLMDKVKAQAEQAVAKAQQGIAQGQAKVDEMQTKRHVDAALRDLGAAYYAQQREGGSAESVATALAAVDAAKADAPEESPAAGSSSPSPGGSFSLDDV